MSTLPLFRISLLIVLATTFVGQFTVASAQDSTPPSTPAPLQPISSANPPLADQQGEPSAAEQFLLPGAKHPWARFPVGSWRQILVTTETFDEAGKLISRNETTQQESLQSVSEDRYELNVQATVDLVGKRIVGQWITRVLHTATDGAGQVVESRRLEDQSVRLATGEVNCQVWDVLYRDDARSLVDRIFYSPEQFPYVLRREKKVFRRPWSK